MSDPHRSPAGPISFLGAVTALLILANIWFLWKPRADQVSGDTLIHLVFARNAVEGHPFEYNLGHPSRAMTAPLWNWLLAAVGAVTGTAAQTEGFLLAFRGLSAAFLLLDLALMWHLARRLGAGPVWAAGGLAVLASNPVTFYWIVANPMETAGAAAVAVAMIRWAGRASMDSRIRVWAAGGILTGAGFLIRPELVAFGGLAAASAFLGPERRPWRGSIAWAGATATALGAWSGYLAWSGLAMLPNAASARRLMLLLHDARHLPLIGLPWSPDAFLFLALFVPLLAGAVRLAFDVSPERRAAGLAASCCAAFSLLFFSFYFYTTW